jgi:PhoPQ-activated pathogenicity-related protein
MGQRARTEEERDFRLVSQTWQGIRWEHEVIVVRTASKFRRKSSDAAILIITGGKSNDKDLADARIISRISGLPVATLFQIPNQPLYGMKEDDLIAHTFEEFLKSGDASWPLLFPMAKSAIRAMDGLEHAMGYHRFVVTGASKRGWTTWLTAASGDKRIVGIAPIVYNNLNLFAQVPHQHELWGYYSEQIADYTRRGLQDALKTPRGQVLGRIVDPYSYLPAIHIPIFMLNGANDPYWAPDALSLFSKALPGTARALFLPNEAHTFHDKTMAWQSIGTFSRLAIGRGLLPACNAWIEGRTVRTKASKGLISAQVYVAESDNYDFHLSTWVPMPGFVLPVSTRKQGALVVFTFDVGGEQVAVSSSILLVR